MVGAVLVKAGKLIGRGWHKCAGQPHAEIEALRDAATKGHSVNGATLYVTLEPCSTHGRTPPCTEAIISARIKEVVTGATDPNPKHRGRAFALLKRAGIVAGKQLLEAECTQLNEAFNHWVVHRTPLVTVKAAMTLDGKIATADGESKWITGERARSYAMQLRQGSDAILVGINTILADDPSLTVRNLGNSKAAQPGKRLRRIVLDAMARTPMEWQLVKDAHPELTTIVVSKSAPKRRIIELQKRVEVLVAPVLGKTKGLLDLGWLLKKLGQANVTSLLVEGGGEVNASFLFQGLTHKVAFFYAPKILGGKRSKSAVSGAGAENLNHALKLYGLEWRQLGADWLLQARVAR
jgi:diaminohydroxyphosphoribosylaminopyrimidine deaminase/5-amino-6-(5-phosphoribosylamino)uracil reductase